tara:strand:+ start:180 stop:686 length:507 start_codon:yes stop_codon:yes gene_type:complete
MKNRNDFEERMAKSSNEALINIMFNERISYDKEAVDCAERHLLNRGVDLTELTNSVKFKENGQALIDQAFNYGVIQVIDNGVDYIRLKDELIFKGISVQEASKVVNKIEKEIKKAKNTDANNDLIYGALWCIGGIVATAAEIGYIFWGAIVFGGYQFLKGLINSMNNK